VPGPGWHDEGVALLPIEALTGDDAVTTALSYVVNGAGYMAVGLGVLSAPQELQYVKSASFSAPQRGQCTRWKLLEHRTAPGSSLGPVG